MELKRIGPLSLARISTWIYGCMGLIVGIIFALVGMIGSALGFAQGEPGSTWPLFFGAGAIIFMPIFYGLLGFIGGLLTGVLYNFAARMGGGIEIELISKENDG